MVTRSPALFRDDNSDISITRNYREKNLPFKESTLMRLKTNISLEGKTKNRAISAFIQISSNVTFEVMKSSFPHSHTQNLAQDVTMAFGNAVSFVRLPRVKSEECPKRGNAAFVALKKVRNELTIEKQVLR